MKKVKLPDAIDVSYHTLKVVLLEPDIALEVGDQQGSYAAREQKIYLDRSIIEEGGDRALSLLLHEVGHALYYIFNLKDREEEPTVDSFANGYTEVFKRNPKLLNWITQQVWD